jgi:hypothetical protein
MSVADPTPSDVAAIAAAARRIEGAHGYDALVGRAADAQIVLCGGAAHGN